MAEGADGEVSNEHLLGGVDEVGEGAEQAVTEAFELADGELARDAGGFDFIEPLA